MNYSRKTRLLLCLLPFIWALCCLGCQEKEPGRENPPERPHTATYAKLDSLFEISAQLSNVAYSNNRLQVIFNSNFSLSFSSADSDCRLMVSEKAEDFPIVQLDGDRSWLVNGNSTGKSPDDLQLSLVVLFCDYDGLYAFTSAGDWLFFHLNRVEEIGFFHFDKQQNPKLTKSVQCHIQGAVISALLPAFMANSTPVAHFALRGERLTAEGITIENQITPLDYFSLSSLTLHTQQATREYQVKIEYVKPIPVLRIQTAGGASIVSQSIYLSATLQIEDPELLYEDQTLLDLTTEIRGRGNSTWDMPKKPYKLKLSSKRKMMGMSTDKEWALLAEYSDKTLLRNTTAYSISRRLQMDWTPRMRPVELYLNKKYQGVYMLTEHKKVSAERVNITPVEADDNSGETLTGDYYFEIDQRHDGDRYFDTDGGLPVLFADPKKPTEAQFDYCKDYFQAAEDALYSADFQDVERGYARFIDLESFAKNYVIHELVKNIDGNMRLSTFLTKPRNGKLRMCHVWDFDLTLGNCDYFPPAIGNGATGFYVREALWYKRMLEDPAFVAQVKRIWNMLYPQISDVERETREMALRIEEAQKRNFVEWNILGYKVWPNVVALGSYSAELDYMLNFLTERSQWLNDQISRW